MLHVSLSPLQYSFSRRSVTCLHVRRAERKRRFVLVCLHVDRSEEAASPSFTPSHLCVLIFYMYNNRCRKPLSLSVPWIFNPGVTALLLFTWNFPHRHIFKWALISRMFAPFSASLCEDSALRGDFLHLKKLLNELCLFSGVWLSLLSKFQTIKGAITANNPSSPGITQECFSFEKVLFASLPLGGLELQDIKGCH